MIPKSTSAVGYVKVLKKVKKDPFIFQYVDTAKAVVLDDHEIPCAIVYLVDTATERGVDLTTLSDKQICAWAVKILCPENGADAPAIPAYAGTLTEKAAPATSKAEPALGTAAKPKKSAVVPVTTAKPTVRRVSKPPVTESEANPPATAATESEANPPATAATESAVQADVPPELASQLVRDRIPYCPGVGVMSLLYSAEVILMPYVEKGDPYWVDVQRSISALIDRIHQKTDLSGASDTGTAKEA